MDETEIISAVRQLAVDLRELVPGALEKSDAFKQLQSVPGKGGPLVQWFNRETDAQRKRVISEIMGHMARASYQQKPEFYKSAADDLEALCDRLQPQEK
jgi:hypothetical protein